MNKTAPSLINAAILFSSIAMAITNHLFYAGVTLAFGLLGLLLISRSNATYRTDSEAVAFLRNLLENCKKDKAALSIIRTSISSDWRMYKEIKRAINQFRLTGQSSFSIVLKSYNSELLSEISSIIDYSLEHGTDMYRPMLDIEKRFGALEALRIRNRSLFNSSMSTVKLGSILFLPIFGGISIDILHALSPTSKPAAISSILAMFLFYIVAANYINTIYSNLTNTLKLTHFMLYNALAILILKFASTLALSVL